MSTRLSPQFLPLADLVESLPSTLREIGHAALSPDALAQLSGTDLPSLDRLRESWNDLPADAYLRDGGRYRRRRHSCFVVDGREVTQVPHRAHWQPVAYNALHGGIERWFDPMRPEVVADPAWPKLLQALAEPCSTLKGRQPWFVEAHQFRIDTTDGIGRPTPEGAHRDGVDFVAVLLIDRHGVKGGETRVFDAEGPNGIRFTMTEPWTTLLLDDERVVHETTPIQPLVALAPGGAPADPQGRIHGVAGVPSESQGHRDTLVLTFRSGGFQGPG